jgi:hypothetical protein
LIQINRSSVRRKAGDDVATAGPGGARRGRAAGQVPQSLVWPGRAGSGSWQLASGGCSARRAGGNGTKRGAGAIAGAGRNGCKADGGRAGIGLIGGNGETGGGMAGVMTGREGGKKTR